MCKRPVAKIIHQIKKDDNDVETIEEYVSILKIRIISLPLHLRYTICHGTSFAAAVKYLNGHFINPQKIFDYRCKRTTLNILVMHTYLL